MTHRRLNVRCCCQPQKILGTLPYAGSPFCEQFKYMERVRATDDPSAPPDHRVDSEMRIVELEVHEFSDSKYGLKELAYKAEGLSMETLRKLPGFIEFPNVSDLKSCIDQYLKTLDDRTRDEQYLTDRGYASQQLNQFREWLTATRVTFGLFPDDGGPPVRVDETQSTGETK